MPLPTDSTLNYIVLLPQVHALHPITPAQAESSAAPLRCCLNFLPLWHPGEPSKCTLWLSFTTPYFCRIKYEVLRLASRAIYLKLPATCPLQLHLCPYKSLANKFQRKWTQQRPVSSAMELSWVFSEVLYVKPLEWCCAQSIQQNKKQICRLPLSIPNSRVLPAHGLLSARNPLFATHSSFTSSISPCP